MRKRHDYSSMLIWAAALVTVVRYAGAFIASDVGEVTGWVSEALSLAMGLTGLGMGVLDVLGGAYIFDGWRRAMPRTGQRWPFRFRVLTGFVFGLFGFGIYILVPFTVSRVSHQSMEHVLGDGLGLWIWSTVVNMAPYLLIGGVVTGNVGIVTAGAGDLSRARRLGQETLAEQAGKLPERGGAGRKVTGEIKPMWLDWREVPESEYKTIAGLKSVKVMQLYGVPERTARNWVVRAKAAVGNGNRPLQEELPVISDQSSVNSEQ